MGIAAIALAGLMATGVPHSQHSPGRRDGHARAVALYPLQPATRSADRPRSGGGGAAVPGQIAELHDMWGSLTPDERSQRIKVLQQVAPLIDAETRTLPPGQQLQVERHAAGRGVSAR